MPKSSQPALAWWHDAPAQRQGDWTPGPAGGGDLALRAAGAIPTTELSGVGLPMEDSARCAAAMVMNEWHVVVGEKVPAGENL